MLSNQINIETSWHKVFDDEKLKKSLEIEILPLYINTCRWFAGKARKQSSLEITKIINFSDLESRSYLLILKVNYSEGEFERYFLPLGFIDMEQNPAKEIAPKGVISVAYCQSKRGLLVDALFDETFQQALFKNLANANSLEIQDGNLVFTRGRGLSAEDISAPISSRVLLVEQSNSSLIFGEKYFMKLYRKLFDDTNPEVEMVAFLTENSNFAYIPAFAGSITLHQNNGNGITLGLMQRMVENQTDSWSMMGENLGGFMEAFDNMKFTIDEQDFEKVELLAKRTAEMHLALYQTNAEKEFVPEPFDTNYRNFFFNRLEKLLENRYSLLLENYTKLDTSAQALAWSFMEAKELIDEFIEDIKTKELDSLRIRIHGDYHLGQILATNSDYIIIDFEGEPESSITDRKIKHSPLKDVAGMIRSYHYAVSSKFLNAKNHPDMDSIRVQKASDRWFGLIQKTFTEKYLATFGYPHPLFKNNNEINFLMLIYLLEKAVYELGYEISYRPDWVKIPLKGINDVIKEIEKLKFN